MKKAITILGLIASANVFAYTTILDNQSNLDIVVKKNGSTVCTFAKNTKSSCDNMDAYTTYAVNYKLSSTSEQGLLTLQKNTQQILQVTPVTPSQAIADYLINYQAQYIRGVYSGAVDNFINQNGGFTYTGYCKGDHGGVACPLSDGDNLSTLYITAISSFVPGPEPKPQPTPIKTTSGMYISEEGNWVSGTIYQPFWSNDVNAMVYPEVNDNGQTYAACWAIDPTNKSISPSQSYQNDSQGVWRKFANNQAANVCDIQAAKARAMSATAVKFW